MDGPAEPRGSDSPDPAGLGPDPQGATVDRAPRGAPTLGPMPLAALVPVVLAVLVIVTRWPAWTLVPDAALDADWMLALNVAQRDGLRWGSQVVFTYGPLGYTIAPQLPGAFRILVASAVFALGAGCTAFWLYRVVRPSLGAAPSFLVAGAAAYLILSLPFFGEGGLLVAVITGSLVSLRGASLRHLAVVGCLVGLLGQQAIAAAAVGAVVALSIAFAVRGVRGLATVAAAAGGIWLGVWLLTGQSLADLPGYVSGGWQVVTGYSAAMTLEMAEVRWTYGAAAVIGVLLIALAVSVALELRPAPRAGLLAAVAVAGWWGVKEGFTRHDAGHTAVAVALVALVAVCLALVASRTRSRALGAAVVLACVTTIGLLGWPGIAPSPLDGLKGLARTAQAVVDPAAGEREAAAAYAALVPVAGADRLRAEVAGRATIADPLGIGTVLGLDGRPAPLPPVELYSSYTPALDALNTQSLADDPRQVLRAVPYWSVDERNPYWDSPSYQHAIYCRYDEAVATASWLLLRPTTQDRCASPVSGASVEVAANEAVAVPRRQGAMTLVSITPHPSLPWQAARLLLKGRPVRVDYGGTRYRLASSPTAEGLMLNAPVPSAAFRDLPADPYPTISVDVDSTLAFSFIPVVPRAGAFRPAVRPDRAYARSR
jgi:hypothetical protein